MNRFKTVLDQMICRFQDDEVTALGAQLTYFLILSFFPFLIFLLTIMSHTPLVREEVLTDLFALLPESSNKLVMDIINETVESSSNALLSIGMLAAIWTSSSGVMAVFRGINKAYDTEENRPFWKVRLFSIFYMLIFAVLIVLTFIMLIFGKLIADTVTQWMLISDSFQQLWSVGRYVIPFGMMIMVFTLLYKQAPNYKIRWLQALPGALFTTCCWIAISILFSYYVTNFGNFARTYGSIGGVIALLIWMYISSIVVILGGELNATLQFIKEGKTKSDCKSFGFRLPFFKKKKPGGP
jgi:membrane protein